MRGKWAIPAVAAVVVLAGLSIVMLRNRRKPPPVPVAAAVVVEEDAVSLHGAVRPQHIVNVGASVSGVIDSFLVEVGEDVFAGQALARIGSSGLDHAKANAVEALERAQDQVTKLETAVNAARMEQSRADADAQRAKAQLDRLQKIFERQNALYRGGATPKQAYEKAVLDYEAAVKEFEVMDKATRTARENVQSHVDLLSASRTGVVTRQEEVQDAQGNYSEAEVRSPADGTVIARNGEPGKLSDEAGDKMFQIATDLYALEVTLEAKPEILKRIHPGQSATVMVLDIPNMGLPGTVKEVKETEVVVEFENNLLGIRPGMRADVRFRFE